MIDIDWRPTWSVAVGRSCQRDSSEVEAASQDLRQDWSVVHSFQVDRIRIVLILFLVLFVETKLTHPGFNFSGLFGRRCEENKAKSSHLNPCLTYSYWVMHMANERIGLGDEASEPEQPPWRNATISLESNCMELTPRYFIHPHPWWPWRHRYQPEGCHRPAGSCLFEQLDDFHNEATWEQIRPLVIHSR